MNDLKQDRFVVEMLNITKEFPGIKANDNITLQVKKQSIHALLGENGAGKSTLMSVLFGLYKLDEGEIKVNGKVVNISNPNIATELGIGMVHQHFKLVEDFTVVENIILGDEVAKLGVLKLKEAAKRVKQLSQEYGLNVDLQAKVKDISVGQQQRVEILKMLYRDAQILIFDEPTAVLTPQEIDSLLEIMRELVKQGKSIILITHKLKEIKAIANYCTIIRKGRGIKTVDVSKTSTQEMAALMVGRDVSFEVDKPEIEVGDVVLTVNNLNLGSKVKDKHHLKNISFAVKSKEIVGIAGIEGNGQSALIKCLTGLEKKFSGQIKFKEHDVSKYSVRKRTNIGFGHIPEDRQHDGLVLEYTLEDNLILQTYFKAPFSNHGFLNRKAITKHSKELEAMFDVRSARSSKTIVASMSGGNQQKAIIARELTRRPNLIIAGQPTRGLDVGAIEFVHNELILARNAGAAILLVSLELDEILAVSDRILVMYEGEIIGELITAQTNEREVGLLMAGSKLKGEHHA